MNRTGWLPVRLIVGDLFTVPFSVKLLTYHADICLHIDLNMSLEAHSDSRLRNDLRHPHMMKLVLLPLHRRHHHHASRHHLLEQKCKAQTYEKYNQTGHDNNSKPRLSNRAYVCMPYTTHIYLYSNNGIINPRHSYLCSSLQNCSSVS